MVLSSSGPLANRQAAATGQLFAVQQDTAVSVDWQLPIPSSQHTVHFEQSRSGTVFILDAHGAQIGDTGPITPTDHAADDALAERGFCRSSPWSTDAYGRRTATLTDTAPIPEQFTRGPRARPAR